MHLYWNKFPLQPIIYPLLNCNLSSFHYIEKCDSFLSKTRVVDDIKALKLNSKFSIQFGNFLPLHIYNVTPLNIVAVKEILSHENVCGTFIFKGHITAHVHEIISAVLPNVKLMHFTLKEFHATVPLLISKLIYYNAQESEIKKITTELKCRPLTHLDMSSTCITGRAAKEVAEVFSSNCLLENLNLSNCKLRNEGIQVICKSLNVVTKLKFLKMSNNHFNLIAAKDMACVLENSTCIQQVNLCNCNLHKEGIEAISSALKCSKLLYMLTEFRIQSLYP